jgi:hypothetical protein
MNLRLQGNEEQYVVINCLEGTFYSLKCNLQRYCQRFCVCEWLQLIQPAPLRSAATFNSKAGGWGQLAAV